MKHLTSACGCFSRLRPRSTSTSMRLIISCMCASVNMSSWHCSRIYKNNFKQILLIYCSQYFLMLSKRLRVFRSNSEINILFWFYCYANSETVFAIDESRFAHIHKCKRVFLACVATKCRSTNTNIHIDPLDEIIRHTESSCHKNYAAAENVDHDLPVFTALDHKAKAIKT